MLDIFSFDTSKSATASRLFEGSKRRPFLNNSDLVINQISSSFLELIELLESDASE